MIQAHFMQTQASGGWITESSWEYPDTVLSGIYKSTLASKRHQKFHPVANTSVSLQQNISEPFGRGQLTYFALQSQALVTLKAEPRLKMKAATVTESIFICFLLLHGKAK